MNNDDQWTDAECRYFLQQYMEERTKGNKTKGGLNQTGKDSIIQKFDEKFGKRYVWAKFKNKYDVCKRTYNKLKNILYDKSGLGYDSLGRLKMTDHWWDEREKEWLDAKKFKNKLVPNMDLYVEEFGAVNVTGAEGWSAQQGETSLDSRVGAENDDEVDSFDTVTAPTTLVPPVVGKQTRAGSSGSKRKRKEIDMVTDTCSSRNIILARKNELVGKMLDRDDSCSVNRVLEILNDLPGVTKWSLFHRASVDHLLADLANRQGFTAFSSVEDKISYLEHRTGINLE